MNRRQKIIVSVTGIFLVLLILVGLTYAYFLTQIQGNENTKSISVTTANLELVYGDGTTSLLTSSTPIEPGKFTSSKDFTVTNNGNALTDYAVTLEAFSIVYANDTVINGQTVKAGTVTKMEFPEDMKMEITCTIESDDEDRDGQSCVNQKIGGTLPIENSILLTNSIEIDDIHKYVLTLTYVDSGFDQSADMNKTIQGKIDIIDLKATLDLEGTVATYQTGDYVEINSTPVKSEIIDGKYKLIGVEPGSHTLYVKYKDSEGNEQVRGFENLIINKGEEASVSGNTITFTEDYRIAVVNINNNYELNIEKIKKTMNINNIFSNNNLFSNGDFEQPIEFMLKTTVNAGLPVISTEVSNSGFSSLKCFGSTTQNLKTTASLPAGDYYAAARIRIDRYVTGSAGVVVSGGGFNYNDKVINLIGTTNGQFVTSSGIFTVNNSSAGNIFYGSYSSADLDAYIDDIVIIPLSVFDEIPTQAELDDMYIEYVASETPSDTEYLAAFMDRVNAKAAALGMSNSSFSTPSGVGFEEYNSSTARDIMKLMIAASNNDILVDILKTKAKSISIDGPNSRTETIYPALDTSYLSEYTVLGGKGGSWKGVYNLGLIGEIDGNKVVTVIMNAPTTDDRNVAMKELFDLSANVLADSSYDTSSSSISDSIAAISCVVSGDSYEVLFEQNADTKYRPASVTKVLTVLTALDYIDDLDDEITIKSFDLIQDAYGTFKLGDVMSYEEAFYEMMLISSNQSATAVGRILGENL